MHEVKTPRDETHLDPGKQRMLGSIARHLHCITSRVKTTLADNPGGQQGVGWTKAVGGGGGVCVGVIVQCSRSNVRRVTEGVTGMGTVWSVSHRAIRLNITR